MSTFTDKVGTEAQDPSDRMAVMKLYNQVPKVVPNEIIVRLPYHYHNSYDTPAGITGIQYKVNSIYDPDFTNISGNYQPLGRDTWASIFNYYKVLETKIYWQFGLITTSGNTDSNDLGVAGLPFLVGGMLNLDATIPSSFNNWLMSSEAGQSNRQQIFTPVQFVSPIIGEPKTCSINMDWNPTLFETAILDQSTKDTWTPVGSDPDNVEYFSALVANNSILERGAWFRVHIEYMVSFKQVNKTLLNTIN